MVDKTENDLSPRQRALAGEFVKEGHSMEDAIRMAWSTSDPAQTEKVPSAEDIARTICLSYGRDPDEMASIGEMCDANDRPVAIWRAYEEQADAILEAHSLPAHAQGARGSGAWCQPMDCGKHTSRKFMIYFEDPDHGIMVFDNEAEARDAFARKNTAWNCYLMASLPLEASALPSTACAPAAAKNVDFYAWPVGCHSPNWCHRNGRCMYVGCKYDGEDIAALAALAISSTVSGGGK